MFQYVLTLRFFFFFLSSLQPIKLVSYQVKEQRQTNPIFKNLAHIVHQPIGLIYLPTTAVVKLQVSLRLTEEIEEANYELSSHQGCELELEKQKSLNLSSISKKLNEF